MEGTQAGVELEAPGTVDHLIEQSPPDVSPTLLRLREEPPQTRGVLSTEIAAYLRVLEQVEHEAEFLDLALAKTIGARCQALLDGVQPDSETHDEDLRLVQLAVRYFIEDDDAESDIRSPIGFDDDALVVELVARALGREDVLHITAEDA